MTAMNVRNQRIYDTYGPYLHGLTTILENAVDVCGKVPDSAKVAMVMHRDLDGEPGALEGFFVGYVIEGDSTLHAFEHSDELRGFAETITAEHLADSEFRHWTDVIIAIDFSPEDSTAFVGSWEEDLLRNAWAQRARSAWLKEPPSQRVREAIARLS